MFCSQCGASADGSATICGQCGVDLAVPAKPAFNTERAVAASKDAARAIRLLLVDPVGSIGAAYDAFRSRQAMDVGIALCALFVLASILATRMLAGAAQRFSMGIMGSIGFKEVIQIALLAAIPIISVAAIFTAMQLIAGKRQELSRTLFATGAILLPASFFNVIGGILGLANAEVIALAALFALCYTILLLYAACRDVLKVASPIAAVAVPLIILGTAWLTKIILAAAI